MIGALIGEMIGGKKLSEALKPAFGSFIGFLFGTAIKLSLTLVMGYHFVVNIL